MQTRSPQKGFSKGIGAGDRDTGTGSLPRQRQAAAWLPGKLPCAFSLGLLTFWGAGSRSPSSSGYFSKPRVFCIRHGTRAHP